jgi:singapore isolate B (sub-type 7) whole genome shotgun sequence assembly, scaffold_7
VIKGDNCTISIPEIQLDIPASTQRGDLNTVEGVISRVADQLRQEQPYRKETCPEVYEQIEAFCKRLDALSSGAELPFTLIVDDPSGNSFVENPYLPKKDPHCRVFHYYRTKEQHLVGMMNGDESRRWVWLCRTTSRACSGGRRASWRRRRKRRKVVSCTSSQSTSTSTAVRWTRTRR